MWGTMKLTTHHTRDQRGFSLVELSVVIVVIGVLAAVVVPLFLAVDEARDRMQLELDLSTAAIRVETLRSPDGGYPDHTQPAQWAEVRAGIDPGTTLELYEIYDGFCLQARSERHPDAWVSVYSRGFDPTTTRSVSEGGCMF